MLGAAVLRHHADPLVALPGVRAMQQMSDLPDARGRAEEAEVVEALAAAMLSHPQEESLQLAACQALSSLCASAPLAERAAAAGAVEVRSVAVPSWVEALVRALTFDSVALKAVQALSLLCALAAEPRQRAAEAGALELLAARPRLGWWGAGAMGVICAGSEPHAQRAVEVRAPGGLLLALEAGAVETLVAILRHDAAPQAAAGALGFICGRPARAERAVAAGAVEALLAALRDHPGQLPLQKAAVGALGVIAVATHCPPGALTALLAAARQPDAGLRCWALRAVQAMETWQEAEEIECIAVCSVALAEHPTDAKVQESPRTRLRSCREAENPCNMKGSELETGHLWRFTMLISPHLGGFPQFSWSGECQRLPLHDLQGGVAS